MKFLLPKVYPITDVTISGLTHADQVKRLTAGGASFIQLRDKHADPRDLYDEAQKAIVEASAGGARIIINDRVDIALVVGADGVHLGQDDLPPDRARAILGDKAIIGLSTHTLDQAIAAACQPVDYIAIGPIFETGTKEKPDAPVGLDGLREVRRLIGQTPLVAIGGITLENLRSVFEAGADSAAMIAALISDPQTIDKRMREMLDRSR